MSYPKKILQIDQLFHPSFRRYIVALITSATLEVCALLALSNVLPYHISFLVVRPIIIIYYFSIMKEFVFSAQNRNYIQYIRYALLVIFNFLFFELSFFFLDLKDTLSLFIVYIVLSLITVVFNYFMLALFVFGKESKGPK